MNVAALLIGYGGIAEYVARGLDGDDSVKIAWVLAKPGREAAARERIGGDAKIITDLAGLDGDPDVALECAGHQGLSQHGPAVLERGIDLGILSIGALAEDALADRLEAAARDNGAALEMLAGAVGAIDAIAGAREGGLDRVVYSGRKRPSGWVGSLAEEKLDLDSLTEAAVHFEGSARKAAALYPKNANVAATVALAGLGLDRTSVTLIADPNAPGNTHRVEAEGAFGKLALEIVAGTLPASPRTSALTAMSALRFLRNRARSVRI